MTAKEMFLELLKPDGKPERQLVQYEALQMALGDPAGRFLHKGRRPGATITDLWGTVIEWPEDAPGSMPLVTEENKVIKDITRWRDYVHAPDVVAGSSDPESWKEFREKQREKAGGERLVAGFMGTGIFEQCHFLMPFQEVLTALYDHPREMHELIDYITEFRLAYVKQIIDGLQPDVTDCLRTFHGRCQFLVQPVGGGVKVKLTSGGLADVCLERGCASGGA